MPVIEIPQGTNKRGGQFKHVELDDTHVQKQSPAEPTKTERKRYGQSPKSTRNE